MWVVWGGVSVCKYVYTWVWVGRGWKALPCGEGNFYFIPAPLQGTGQPQKMPLTLGGSPGGWSKTNTVHSLLGNLSWHPLRDRKLGNVLRGETHHECPADPHTAGE